jgi:hypothetical protein
MDENSSMKSRLLEGTSIGYEHLWVLWPSTIKQTSMWNWQLGNVEFAMLT